MVDAASAAEEWHVDWRKYDFIDLGCGRGGSMNFCAKRFGAKGGLGVDLSVEKVREARAAGYDVIVADALSIPPGVSVRFVSMLDFLEHLPNLSMVEQVLAASARVATDFLFIRHPSFEGEAYLRTLGLRQYWWHWSGHTAHIHVSDYCAMFEKLGLAQYFIRYREPILDSAHESILNTDARINQGKFDPSVHSAKPFVEFSEPVWRAQDIFVALRSFEANEWRGIVGRDDRDADNDQASIERCRDSSLPARGSAMLDPRSSGAPHRGGALASLSGRDGDPDTIRPSRTKEVRVPPIERPPSPFIVGASRSGTSLLRAMLNAHPTLAIPPETHFIPDVARACAEADDPRRRFFDAILQSKNWAFLSLDERALFERLDSLRPFNVGDGIRSVFDLYAANQGKPRWGDKTPVYAAHMALIQRLLPEARFIHIIRDGRDVSLSALPLMRRHDPSATIEDAAHYWVRRVRGTRRQGAKVREYLEVRYESIVLDAEPELRRICEFADLVWHPSVLHYYAPPHRGDDDVGKTPRPAKATRVNQPPDASRVQRWRSDMSSEDLSRVEAIAGPLLSELGYSLAG